MRNLKVASLVKTTILSDCDCNSNCVAQSSDNDVTKKKLYIFNKNTLFEVSCDCNILDECDICHLYPGEVPKIIGILPVDIFQSIYTFHENGDVICFKTGNHPQNTHSGLIGDYFTNLDGNPVIIEWSPDKELGVYITGDYLVKLVLLTPTSVDKVNEYHLNDSSEGKHQLINIGWGKKETQFQGVQGKKVGSLNDDKLMNDDLIDRQSFYITWRGDGTMFAVGYWSKISNKRRIKIFNNDGALLCLNEDMPGLDGPMSWKPQGNLIAFSQQVSNKYVISFLEKNGLKHLDFSIPPGYRVNYLAWNTNSSILAMIVEHTGSTCIMLWTTSNYHWYLKQKLQFNFKVIRILWDEQRENKLYIIGNDGTLINVEFIWSIDHSKFSSTINKYFVSVIDNDKILLTPFHLAIIPPPMCKWPLEFPTSVNQILYPPVGEDCKYFLCAILNDGKFCFLCENTDEPMISKIDNTLSNEFGSEISLYHWAWIFSYTLVCVSTFYENKSMIMTISIEDDQLIVIQKTTIGYKIIGTTSKNPDFVSLYLHNGRLIEYNVKENSLGPINDCFPEPCYQIVENKMGIYGLNEWNRFYCMNKELACDVSSFLLYDPFIIATTLNHTLMIMKYNEDENQINEISYRKLERGSKLVGITGNSVIMQMPRGNLETIQPRVLSILNLGKLLDMKLYKEAVHLLRRQKICFDLCVDHDPKEFFANVEQFVANVDPQWITLFVAELLSQDVTRSTYALYYDQKRPNPYLGQSKIGLTCEKLLKALLTANNFEKFMMPILICLVKTKNISKAIELANNDVALQHLLFLVDVDTLYHEALGAYNLQAALKIASKSHMDPKVYIPYLNSLKEMDNNYMKYEIDKLLKRDASALKNLSKCDDRYLNLMFDLIENGRLYNLALEVFENQPERYAKAANLYGEYLYKQARFEESGIMYLRSNDLVNAINAFTKSGNWKQCILLAKRCNYSDNELRNLGDALCSTLVYLKKFNEAGMMFKNFFGDTNKAIEMYLLGNLFYEAIYLATDSKLKNVIENTIKKAVLDSTNNLIEEISNTKTKILGYISRLKQVRLEKSTKPKFSHIVNDDMSDISSISSRSNKSFTSKSSKMTKKMNRKMWSLKEGNPREEEALIATLSQMMVDVQKIVGEVKNISMTLLHLNSDQKANELQKSFKELLNVINNSKSQIWPKNSSEDDMVALDAKYKYPPELNFDQQWELAIFK